MTETVRRETDLSLPNAGLAGILIGYSLPVLTFFSISVALPSLRADLGMSEGGLQLVVALFGVAFAGLVVLGGRFGDQHGRRRVLRVGLVAFLIASIIGALAPEPTILLIARVGQGLGAALIAPQVLSTIQSGTSGAARDRAISLFGAMAGIATSVAFIAGGLLMAADPGGLGWRLVLWLDVPIALLALGALRWVPETRIDGHHRPDPVGALLLIVSVALLVLPLTEGRVLGWPAWTWLCLALFIPATATFLAWERHVERSGRQPVLSSRLTRIPEVRAGLLVTLAFFIAFAGFMFVIAYAAQIEAGLSPLQLGLLLTPFALAFLGASLAGRRVFGPAIRTMRMGTLIAAAGFALLAVTVALAWPQAPALAAVPLALVGFGQGCLVPPLFGQVLSGVPAADAGAGSGLMITTMQLSMGLGSALVGTGYLALVSAVSGVLPLVILLITVSVVIGLLEPLIRLLDH